MTDFFSTSTACDACDKYQVWIKVECKEKSKALSKMLAGLSALLTLQTLNAEPGSPLTTSVTAIEEVTGLHLAQMRKRRLMTS